MASVQQTINEMIENEPGVVHGLVRFQRICPTGVPGINGGFTMDSNDRDAALTALEHVLRTVEDHTQDLERSAEGLQALSADESFLVDARDLGFLRGSPTFKDLADHFGG